MAAIAIGLTTVSPARADIDPACQTLRVSGNPEFIPWSWNDDGRLQGASIRLAQLVAEEVGIQIEVRYTGPLKRNIALLRDNKLDLLVSLPKTTSRGAYIRFTDFYAVDEVVLIKSRDSKLNYVKWDDLSGRHIATTQGNSWGEFLDLFVNNNATVYRTPNLASVLRMVEIGRAEFGLHRYYSVLAALDNPTNRNRVRMVHNHVNILLLHMGFNDASPCAALIEPFNKVLRTLRRSGTISKIVQEEFVRARRWQSELRDATTD